jgi:MarR family transcriptional regulator, lower aerobic nicotinate degradation pathway regulator
MEPAEQPASTALPDRLLSHPIFVMLQIARQARRHGTARNPDGLRLPHYATLSVLADFGPASQREISDRLRFDASDLVAVIDSLEQQGLVTRERDPDDRRRYAVRLTPAGRGELEVTERRSRQWQEEFLAPLAEPERATLRKLLTRLYLYHDRPPVG